MADDEYTPGRWKVAMVHRFGLEDHLNNPPEEDAKVFAIVPAPQLGIPLTVVWRIPARYDGPGLPA